MDVPLHGAPTLKRPADLADPSLAIPTTSPQHSFLEHLPVKRQRLSPPGSSSPLSPLLIITNIASRALLYHTALSAHQASHFHLQQAFVPANVRCDSSDNFTNIHPTGAVRLFDHDHQAADKALGLQLLALDLLHVGLGTSELSDRERVAFGVEFAEIALKVLQALKAELGKGKRKEVDKEKLLGDVRDTLAISVSHSSSISADLARFPLLDGIVTSTPLSSGWKS